MKEYEMIQALSGKMENGRPKVGVQFFHEIMKNDGSAPVLVEDLYIQKPEVRIFKDPYDIVRIDFVYKFPTDMDLTQQYSFLERFFQPKNSVGFSEKDVYAAQVINREIFDYSLLEKIDFEDCVSIETMDGQVCTGRARVDMDVSMTHISLESLELPESDENKIKVFEINEISCLKLGDEVVWSRDMKFDYMPEKSEGISVTEEGRVVLSVHTLTIVVSSLMPHGKVSLTTKDIPLFYSLVPERPNEPAKILRMIFKKDDVVFEEASDEAVRYMEQQSMAEVEAESRSEY